MVECLEVETGRFHICAIQEANIYAKVSCEMQEILKNIVPRRGGADLAPDILGHFISLPQQTLVCLDGVHSMNDLENFGYVTF